MLEKLINKLLNYAQKNIEEAYEEQGLTDEILELQLKLNKIRAEHDIAEKDEFLQ